MKDEDEIYDSDSPFRVLSREVVDEQKIYSDERTVIGYYKTEYVYMTVPFTVAITSIKDSLHATSHYTSRAIFMRKM